MTNQSKFGAYEVIEHTETVAPERFVVFVNKNGRLERARHLGKRGGFKTHHEAVKAASDTSRYGTTNV